MTEKEIVVRSPYDGTELGRVPACDADDVAAAAAAARRALDEPLPAHERAAILDRAVTALDQRQEDFARSIAAEAAKPDYVASFAPEASDLLLIEVRDDEPVRAARLVAPDGTAQEAVVADEFNNWFPHPSPDGRWVLYSSDESGRSEVYVTDFPGLLTLLNIIVPVAAAPLSRLR